MRALIVIRLSRLTDASTSPERQRESCEVLCRQRGYEIVGTAEDIDVSAGKTTPFDRPQLGDWLNNRLDEFDVIVFYRMDRIVRRLFDLADLIRWCKKHSKTIVSATESFLDLTHDYGDIIAMLVAKTAEMELAAISARNASAAQHNIKAGKWRGGVPPWGYRPDDSTGEWRFVQDKQQVDIINEVVSRVLHNHEPLNRISHDLIRRGVLTPKDRFAEIRGREPKGCEWSVTTLKRSLLSDAMLGHAVSGGKSVRNDDGSPVVRSEPILTREVFDQLRVELEGRSTRGEPTERTSSLLLRVLHCGVCKKPAYKFNGGSHSQFPRYRCKSLTTTSKCGNRTIQLDYVDNLVMNFILEILGESERQERVWDSGSDHSAELAEINAELTDVAGLIGSPAFRSGTPQRVQLDKRIEALSARQELLSAEDVKPSGWTWKPTGEKFSDWWEGQDIAERNIWLRSMNVRAEFDRGGLHIDLGDLETLTQGMNLRGRAVQWQEMFENMREDAIAGMEIHADGSVTVHPKDDSIDPLHVTKEELTVD